jgi:hypothetical protein
MNICSYAKEDGKRDAINKEFYFNHYQSFEKYIFGKRKEVNLRKIPGVGVSLVKAGARASGYDDFAIQFLPLSYSLFDRDEDDFKEILQNIGSDKCIDSVNVLLERCREKPGDLNWIVRVTYQEGKRLEEEKLKKTGRAATDQEKDTFVAIGFLVRYLIKNKLFF